MHLEPAPPTGSGEGSRSPYTSRSMHDFSSSDQLFPNKDPHLSARLWILLEVALAEYDTLLLTLIPSPDSVELPQTLTHRRPVIAPRLLARGVDDALRGKARGHRERARPVPNGGRVTGPEHEGLECGGWLRDADVERGR